MTRMPRHAFLSFFLVLCAVSARAERTISFEPYAVPSAGTVVVPVREGETGKGPFAAVDALTSGALQRAVRAAGFSSKRGEMLALPGIGRYDAVLLVGLGTTAADTQLIEDFGGLTGQWASQSRAARIDVLWAGGQPESGSQIAFGAALGQYRFDRYATGSSEGQGVGEGTLVVRTLAAEQNAHTYRTQWQPVAEAVAFARDLVTEPANELYPERFVAMVRERAGGTAGLTIEVLDVPAMQKLNMGGLLSVGKGSARPPRLLVLRYEGGTPGEAPLAFVGKGITFDTGGISLKEKFGLWEMKGDMAGAAAVTGAVLALAGRRAPVNAVALAALAENMPSGTAARPGDVVRTMSGKTYEIMSTDAEGRQVLADAVWYAQTRFEPRLVIDLATLTGAIITALGDEYAGLFSRDERLAEQLLAAGVRSGEELWRMPLHPSYAEDLKSPIADLRETGGAHKAGAGIGAHFIGEWVRKDVPWAHLDIAGVAWRGAGATPTVPEGASAFGVRLLDRLVRDLGTDQKSCHRTDGADCADSASRTSSNTHYLSCGTRASTNSICLTSIRLTSPSR